jgi:hypothetical protein
MNHLILFLLPLSGSLAFAHDGDRTFALRSSASAMPLIEKTIIHTTVRKRHDISLSPRNATQAHGASGSGVSSSNDPSSGPLFGGMATLLSWPHSSHINMHAKRSVVPSHFRLGHNESISNTDATMATIFSWPVPFHNTLRALTQRSAESPNHQHDDETTAMATVFPWPISASLSFKARTKRSTNLYALHIPLGGKEGHLDIFLPNTTSLLLCKDVPDTLYDDSLKTFHNLGLRVGDVDVVIPVREEQAEEFCQTVKKGEEVKNGMDSPKLADGANKKSTLTALDDATTTTSDAGDGVVEASALKPRPSKVYTPTPTKTALVGVDPIFTMTGEGDRTLIPSVKPTAMSEIGAKDAPEQVTTKVLITSPTQQSTAADLLSSTPTKKPIVHELATPASASSMHDVSLSDVGNIDSRHKSTPAKSILAAPSMSIASPIVDGTSDGDNDANEVFVPEKDYKVKGKATESSITSVSKSNVMDSITSAIPPAYLKAAGATTSVVTMDAVNTSSLTGSSINIWADYIKSYMDSATSTNVKKRSVPTGIITSPTSSNAAVPRPNRLKVLTQLVRRRPRNLEPADDTVEAESREDGVMPQDPDDLFVAPPKSSSSTAAAITTTADTLSTSSMRVPAKARPGVIADPTDIPSATPILRRPDHTTAPTPSLQNQPFDDPNLLDEINASGTHLTLSPSSTQESGVTIKKKPRPSPAQDSGDADANKDEDADSDAEDTTPSPTTTSKHSKPTSSTSSSNSNVNTDKDSNSPSIPIPKPHGNNNNSSSNSTRYYQTSWGQTNYPEMRVSLYVLWGMVGLQVLCGINDFRRMAWGEWDLGIRG